MQRKFYPSGLPLSSSLNSSTNTCRCNVTKAMYDIAFIHEFFLFLMDCTLHTHSGFSKESEALLIQKRQDGSGSVNFPY